MERSPTDDGWDPNEFTKIAPAPKPTAEIPREKLAELLDACKAAHPRTVRRR